MVTCATLIDIESFETPEARFVSPDLELERGEFERVATTYNIPAQTLIEWAKEGTLQVLDETIWQQLDNTDSNRFEAHDWQTVAEFSAMAERNWKDLKQKMDQGIAIDAPIIMQNGAEYHLVAGNTRLMVARAAGAAPKIWLFPVKINT